MKRTLIIAFIAGAALVTLAAVALLIFTPKTEAINSYQDCVDHGYPIQESYPTRCITPDGQSFTGPMDSADIPATTAVAVYFSESPQSNQEFSYTTAALRVTDRGDLENYVIEELIKGPLDTESNDGLFSSLKGKLSGESNCDGKDFHLDIKDGSATLQFCRTISSAGIGDDGRMLAIIRDSLKQFNTITTLSILDKNGNQLGDMSR